MQWETGMELPAKGSSWETLKPLMESLKSNDYAWKSGRLPLYVYWRDEELYRVAKEASSLYFVENGLGKRAFPSAQKLEHDVISMVLNLMQADEAAAGSFTSGGTESIFLAVKSARDFGARNRAALGKSKMVLAHTAHPAFDKAAGYLDMEVVRTPVAADYRADVRVMEREIDSSTVLVVGSAPAYPHGVYDPIEDLAELSRKHGVWLHVDACVGGMLSPFIRKLGYDVPPYDFSIDGVSSMSVDLHKYGFSAKGASTVLFQNKRLKEYSRFHFSNWPRGVYATDTFLGTRPASPIASAWAVMNYLGEEGYLEMARTTMETKRRFTEGINSIPGLKTLEPGELSFLLYRSTDPEIDINAVADGMSEKGWFVGRCNAPSSIHLMFNPVHAPVAEEYLEHLEQVVSDVRKTGKISVLDEETY